MFCEETERHFLQRLGKLRGRTNFMHFVLPMHLTPSRSCASAKDWGTVSNQLELTNSETMDGLHDTVGEGARMQVQIALNWPSLAWALPHKSHWQGLSHPHESGSRLTYTAPAASRIVQCTHEY